MDYRERVAGYLAGIDQLSHSVLAIESLINRRVSTTGDIMREISNHIDKSISGCQDALDSLSEYFSGVEYFLSRFGHESTANQAGRLSTFRPDKFMGDITIESRGPLLIVRFSDMRDLLHAKFAKRGLSFSQDDRMSGFFRMVHLEGHSIPMCAIVSGYNEITTIIHECTHFRNHVIGSDYYSSGGGRDMYESVVYDDLAEEILAFFSEGSKRSEVQMTLLHDQRYHFYRRIEGWGARERNRFIDDVSRYINIARAVKELREDTYLVDLAIIPLHRWPRYLGYLEDKDQIS